MNIALENTQNFRQQPRIKTNAEREQKFLRITSLVTIILCTFSVLFFGLPEILFTSWGTHIASFIGVIIMLAVSIISYRLSLDLRRVQLGGWLLMSFFYFCLYFVLFQYDLWYPLPIFFIFCLLMGMFLLPWQATLGYSSVAVFLTVIAYLLNTPTHAVHNLSLLDLNASMAIFWFLGLTLPIVVGVYIASQLKQAVNMTVTQNERLEVTLGSITDGVFAFDKDGEIILANRVAHQLTGFSQENILGSKSGQFFQMLFGSFGAELVTMLDRVLRYGESGEFNKQSVAGEKAGEERFFSGSIAPTRDSYNNIIGAVFVLRDVTVEQKIAGELFRASKLETIGTLAGGIAHDFNNILTAVIGNLEIARLTGNNEAERETCLDEVQKAVDRAVDLSRQLLTFSKGGEPLREQINLVELVQAAVSSHRTETRCEIAVLAEPEAVLVDGDVKQLTQVVQILMENAIQAQPRGGKVQVTVGSLELEDKEIVGLGGGSFARVAIRDWGTGIPSHLSHRIFDPFFTTRNGQKGLGLATAFSIIKKHGGHIEFKSNAGGGTTFNFWLPLPVTRRKSSKIAVPAERKTPKGLRVLLMDDEVSILTLVSKVMARRNYEVETARDGEEAIRLYLEANSRQEPFDVVIMDLTIPGGMGGKEAIQKLLAIDSGARVIVSSGYSDDPVIARYWEYGFAGVALKPYTLEDLFKTIENLPTPEQIEINR